jgi:hypothetical protein
MAGEISFKEEGGERMSPKLVFDMGEAGAVDRRPAGNTWNKGDQ